MCLLLNQLREHASWGAHASEHEVKHDGKKWSYLLVPHTAILPSATLNGLAKQYKS